MSEEIKDILAEYQSFIKYPEICDVRARALNAFSNEPWGKVQELFTLLPNFVAKRSLLSKASVIIGEKGELKEEDHEILESIIEALIPWRKGPFSLFGVEIDAEWRSDLKWSRVLPHLDSLSGKKVADIGCSTGYYMFRSLVEEPELVVGFEPSVRCYYSFQLLQRYLQDLRLSFLPIGGEHLTLFPNFFEAVLCMGIIYHQRNPFEFLKQMQEGLQSGGQIILESQAITGKESVALVPKDRYGKARNVYFVPTTSCLVSWLERVGFVEVEVVSEIVLTTEEQRSTRYSPGESLKDFLMPSDITKTIEGYPAPLRVIVKARKR